MKLLPRLFLLLAVLCLANVPAFAKDAPAKDAPAQPINKVCPVDGGEVDPTITTVHKGQTIGFCCAPCIKEFKKDPAKYLAIIAEEKTPSSKDAAAGDAEEPALNAKCPVTGDDADGSIAAEHEGRVIAFCCADCVKDFQKNPKKYLKKLDEAAKKSEAEKKSEQPSDEK